MIVLPMIFVVIGLSNALDQSESNILKKLQITDNDDIKLTKDLDSSSSDRSFYVSREYGGGIPYGIGSSSIYGLGGGTYRPGYNKGYPVLGGGGNVGYGYPGTGYGYGNNGYNNYGGYGSYDTYGLGYNNYATDGYYGYAGRPRYGITGYDSYGSRGYDRYDPYSGYRGGGIYGSYNTNPTGYRGYT